MIAIIDYGAGNIQSVKKALQHIGCECLVTNDKETILSADGAVLPGVGSFGDTMDTLCSEGTDETVKAFIASGKPFLGICLGLQLLFPASEESPDAQGLHIFEGSIRRIPDGEGLKIPHMGWNNLDINPESRLLRGVGEHPYVYFVHSYYLSAQDSDIVAARTTYGVRIDAAIEKGNVFATQFHPEKSGETGLQILRNFAAIVEG
ncbi:MAG: imidazole glycerol phosphate synthase subunit HisH [Ruminococcus sp.]|nr:imidazole glycerol phosphate synthase subunit HisH [Ruminococcus sp.]